MDPTLKKALAVCAALWIAGGTACYCYAFTRDFYTANKHAIHSLIEKIGL